MKRKAPTLREIAAAAIAQLLEIPHEHVKIMTADQIFSLIQVDHYPVTVSVATSLGWGPGQYNHPSNLRITGILAHRHKTATRDVPEIAKTDRISEAHAEFRARMLSKGTGEVPLAPARSKAKIKSRGFQKAPEGHKWFKRGKA